MTAAKKLNLISVEQYLADELNSPIKHEYRGGFVYAMAGGKKRHQRLGSRILGMLHAQLDKADCEPFNSDMKIRIELPSQIRFYYPDVSVICNYDGEDVAFEERPTAIFEVLSERTRALDEGDKKDAYLKIPSLKLYVLVEQKIARVVVFRRRRKKFVSEVYEGLKTVVPLAEIGAELSLARLYWRVNFAELESEEDEDE